MAKWMIYGANGYTGRLIAEEAKRRGLTPILAGRSKSVEELGRTLGFPTQVFSLDDVDRVAHELAGVSLVLHCAGPFSATSHKMLEACLKSRTSYFDITGEIDVFEAIHARDAELKQARISAVPGVGFDVVPTDCVALMLKNKMKDATHLRLAFKSDSGPSAGTAKSSIEGLSLGGRVRRDGRIVSVPVASQALDVIYDKKPVPSALVPWGDVSTAYYSTGIPNIEVYMALPRSVVRVSRVLGVLLRLPFVTQALKYLVERRVTGPSPELLESQHSWVWGEVRNSNGASLSMRLKTPNGYKLTVDSALSCVSLVLDHPLPTGALTPSQAFGAEFVLGLKGVSVEAK